MQAFRGEELGAPKALAALTPFAGGCLRGKQEWICWT